MKKFLLLLGLALGGTVLTACEDFLDVNSDPNNPGTTTPNYLLPSIISNGIQVQSNTSARTAYFTQHLASRSANGVPADQYILINDNSNATFNNTYYLSAGNIPLMNRLAQEEGSAYYVGAGKIMMALLISHVTDMIGDVPYSEAFKGEQNFTPKYDPQEQVYESIYQLLDEGVVEMSKPTSANSRPFYTGSPTVSGDILYQGNTDRWVKLAWSLKARQYHHTTKKANYNPATTLSYLAKGFTSSADDAQLQFQTPVAPLSNTTNFYGPARVNFNSATYGRNFIKYLDGTAFGVVDPRYPIMATTSSVGADPGRGLNPVPTGVTDFYSSYYARELGYQEVITYHELKFIEAEAAFLANQKARALTAYKEGIRLHMTKIGVPAAQITTYLASAAVAQTEADLSLKNIMEQKYIALFLNPEAWVDMRRYDFAPTIYPNLTYPVGASANARGEYPRRLLYPTAEVSFNLAEVLKAGGNEPTFIIKRMWWDMP
ncbi:SusD/RagB family nutrient-binding outer membrane lipoprotein [Hymenobacter busanensis]|uniref:SusD/RagB family nutrient-binding outer membrane lipoprotein n=1 Tax=Hymenobacter busanensis TaxID=2607656 RepID=A0A7L5A2Y0_9BACT|nr:SusD/RagB family nutrient-binding outer membrane lipoprotein [Hymenobacter busanensis]KAA9338170.1 SusD/RagB family nutrient-binding outer membrane lipoprotein [Hymenobacter busanensis]QHJ09405.1 SusD/RagB family nutrient-binding outer membrane lipoprotein [Hymenobacter busanensis]